jgi:hypothetical protein
MEAWGIDSFKSKKKASCRTIPNVSASAEPYDPFNPEASGREVSGIAPSYTGPMPSPPQPHVRITPSGRTKPVEHFETVQNIVQGNPNTPTQDVRNLADKITYKGQVGDYTFACQNYGICAPVEPFANEDKEFTLPPPQSRCGVSVPSYQQPLTATEKARIQKSIEVQNQEYAGKTRILPNQLPPFSRKPIEGYVDEELEDYLSIHDLKATPATKPVTMTPVTDVPEEPEDGQPTPYEKSVEAVKSLSTVKEPPKKETVLRSYYSPLFGTAEESKPRTNMFDILIYIATGILLILLLEQLYRLAVLIGMQQTVRMLEPYLQKIDQLNMLNNA